MHPWLATTLAVCAVAVTLAAVWVLVAVRRAVERVDGVLGILEQELRPLVGQVHALSDDLRGVLKEATQELQRVEMITDQVQTITERVSSLLGALGGFTRAGQLVGLAVSVKKGLNVFIHRMRKE